MIKIVNFMMPMDKFGEMDKFGNGRRREIKNHSKRRNDYFLQTPLLRCNSVNHERLSQQIYLVRQHIKRNEKNLVNVGSTYVDTISRYVNMINFSGITYVDTSGFTGGN